MYINKRFIYLIFLLCLCIQAGAQDLFKGNDLSRINIDNISDPDIAKFQQQLQTNNISFEQAQQIALSKGMPLSELNKLKDRISKIFPVGSGKDTVQNTVSVNRQTAKNDYKTFDKVQPAGYSGVFGSQLFNTPSLSFEPNLRIATPTDYILGPDDELILNIYGFQEANLRLRVQPEGSIIIPQVGILLVAGLTIEEATKLIREKMSKRTYPDLKTGLTKINISLGNIRNIHITILGSSKPGNYTVSSLTTVYNSMYLCGGPDNLGSYREIELIRDNKVYQKIDLYNYVMHGVQKGNLILKEGDVINFPVYKKRVTIIGEVKRPGVFEMLDGESVDQLVYYAGGFTDNAFKATIKVTQLTDRQKKIKDLDKSQFSFYQPANGDNLKVDSILQRIDNGVSINGAVYRPGQFE